MPDPLRKATRDGETYKRPLEVDAAINVALQQTLEEIVERAAIIDRKARDYLPSECLVHLLRKAAREGDLAKSSRLVSLLNARCQGSVRVLVSDHLPYAEEARYEIVGRLMERISLDVSGKKPDTLDFFEAKFDAAVRAIRMSVFRKYQNRHSHERIAPDDLPEPADRDCDFESDAIAREELATVAQHLDRLSPREREALGLRVLLKRAIASKDPDDHTTIATHMKISGRAVRKLLASARKKLSAARETP